MTLTNFLYNIGQEVETLDYKVYKKGIIIDRITLNNNNNYYFIKGTSIDNFVEKEENLIPVDRKSIKEFM